MVVNGIRWVFAPISAILGWFVVLMLGMSLYGFVENSCPADKVISSYCTVDWINNLSNSLIYIGAALSAVVVVLLPTLVAPRYKFRVAVVAYTLGVLTALWLLLGNDVFRLLRGIGSFNFGWSDLGFLATPCIAGAITLFCLGQYFSKKDSLSA